MPGAIPSREYFYTVDREGRLRHQGTVLDDPGFVDFFFRQLRPNDTARHPDHPFVSPCGREMNFVRAADRVIVFRRLIDERALLYAATLTVPFEPRSLRVSREGVLYHAAPVGELGRLVPAVTMDLIDRIEETEHGFAITTVQGPALIPALE
jgi:hypothetical protein